MNTYHVMILSAGRRVELVRCFQEAARKLGAASRVIAADCSDTAPALYAADAYRRLPRISEPGYVEGIIQACLEEQVALIVPTIDTDLLLLAQNKALIERRTGAVLLISDLAVIDICRDKINTQRFLEDNGFLIPAMHTMEQLRRGEESYPLFIKPKSGSSSIHAYKVNSREELERCLNIVPDPIVQDFMEGEEYTADVFLDFASTVVSIVPRLRMATRSGEISKGKIVKDREIIDDVRRLMNVLKPIGHITVQLMKTPKGIQYIEINPRFGGGAPMSIQSGADSCEALYRLLAGQMLCYHENYRDNIMFLRFDSSICINDKMELVT